MPWEVSGWAVLVSGMQEPSRFGDSSISLAILRVEWSFLSSRELVLWKRLNSDLVVRSLTFRPGMGIPRDGLLGAFVEGVMLLLVYKSV